jgi:hypothetical protein
LCGIGDRPVGRDADDRPPRPGERSVADREELARPRINTRLVHPSIYVNFQVVRRRYLITMTLIKRLLGDGDEAEDRIEDARESADDALQNRVSLDARGIDDAAVTGVAVVNEGPDEEPVTVPIARFSLGEDVEDPDYDEVWRLVGEALYALEPAFEGVFVRHFDVQFTFDGDELFEAEECRRVAVTTDLADRFVSDPGFGVGALREAMMDAHDIDDEVAPVAWGECKDYSQNSGMAVVAAGSAAGASAASCAGAGSAAAGCGGGGAGGV